MRWSGDGAQLAVLHAPPDSGDELGIWDVAAGRFTGTVALPNLVAPWQVAFPSADRVVVPNFDRVVAYDLAGAEVDAFPVGDSAVDSIDVAGDAVVVSRLDGTLDRAGRPARPRPSWRRARSRSSISVAGRRSRPSTRSASSVRSARTAPCAGSSTGGPSGRRRPSTSAADGSLVVATSTGAVRLLDPVGAAVAAVLDRPQGDISDVSIAPDDTRVATGVSVQKAAEAWDDTIEVTDLDRAAADFTLGGEAENVTGCSFYEASVVFSPDGTMLASTSHDFTVQISPLADPDATVVLEPHVGSVLDVEFSPDGATLLTAADDGTMRIWDVSRWSLQAELTTSPGGWYSMAFSPDGALLAVSDAAGQIAIIDPTTAAVERTFSGARTVLGDMVFTPDGRSIVAALPDGGVGVWDVASGALAAELRGHTMPVNAVAVSADGTTVVSASQDGTVRSFPLPSA